MNQDLTTLVVNADDLGFSEGGNQGISKAHREGVVTSASLAVTGTALQHAVEQVIQPNPRLGVGLHFCLSAGKAAARPEQVPLLVNAEGYLRWRFESLWRALLDTRQRVPLLEQIEFELNAQLALLDMYGIVPDHIDSERHVHMLPPIFGVVLRAAQARAIPFVRTTRDCGMNYVIPTEYPYIIRHFTWAKFLLLRFFSFRDQRLLNKQARSADHFATLLFTGRMDLALDSILERPLPGITEIMVHPGLPKPDQTLNLANPGLEAYLNSQDRVRELNGCLQAKRFRTERIMSFGDISPVTARAAGS